MLKWVLLFFLIFYGCNNSDFILATDHKIGNPKVEYINQVFYFEKNPRLNIDDNGYYLLQLDTINWQTLHRISGSIIDSSTNSPVVNCRVEWSSSHYWTLGDTLGYWIRQGLNNDLEWVGYDTSYVIGFDGQQVPTINPASYSNFDGEVNTMIAPVQSMIGDTMTIWYSWGGWYTSWKTDFIKIILN